MFSVISKRPLRGALCSFKFYFSVVAFRGFSDLAGFRFRVLGFGVQFCRVLRFGEEALFFWALGLGFQGFGFGFQGFRGLGFPSFSFFGFSAIFFGLFWGFSCRGFKASGVSGFRADTVVRVPWFRYPKSPILLN